MNIANKMLHSDAIGVDAFVSLKALKSEIKSVVTMGNLSTYLLEFGEPEKVFMRAKRLAAENTDIIAPACGVSTSTPLTNIKAMTNAVKEK